MKIKEIWFYVSGFTLGISLLAIIATWDKASGAYRIVYIALLALLLFATWFERKPHKSNSNTNDNSLHILI
jgi:hypothetical protein